MGKISQFIKNYWSLLFVLIAWIFVLVMGIYKIPNGMFWKDALIYFMDSKEGQFFMVFAVIIALFITTIVVKNHMISQK